MPYDDCRGTADAARDEHVEGVHMALGLGSHHVLLRLALSTSLLQRSRIPPVARTRPCATSPSSAATSSTYASQAKDMDGILALWTHVIGPGRYHASEEMRASLPATAACELSRARPPRRFVVLITPGSINLRPAMTADWNLL